MLESARVSFAQPNVEFHSELPFFENERNTKTKTNSVQNPDGHLLRLVLVAWPTDRMNDREDGMAQVSDAYKQDSRIVMALSLNTTSDFRRFGYRKSVEHISGLT